MKTAISIPDELFAEADKAAADLQLSRSALYARALRELLERLRDDAITAQLNAAIAADGQPEAGRSYLRRLRAELERDGGQW